MAPQKRKGPPEEARLPPHNTPKKPKGNGLGNSITRTNSTSPTKKKPASRMPTPSKRATNSTPKKQRKPKEPLPSFFPNEPGLGLEANSRKFVYKVCVHVTDENKPVQCVTTLNSLSQANRFVRNYLFTAYDRGFWKTCETKLDEQGFVSVCGRTRTEQIVSVWTERVQEGEGPPAQGEDQETESTMAPSEKRGNMTKDLYNVYSDQKDGSGKKLIGTYDALVKANSTARLKQCFLGGRAGEWGAFHERIDHNGCIILTALPLVTSEELVTKIWVEKVQKAVEIDEGEANKAESDAVMEFSPIILAAPPKKRPYRVYYYRGDRSEDILIATYSSITKANERARQYLKHYDPEHWDTYYEEIDKTNGLLSITVLPVEREPSDGPGMVWVEMHDEDE